MKATIMEKLKMLKKYVRNIKHEFNMYIKLD